MQSRRRGHCLIPGQPLGKGALPAAGIGKISGQPGNQGVTLLP